MKEIIIHVLCEGQTEQGFVEAVLKPYLINHGIIAVKSVLLDTNKKKGTKGGITNYQKVKNDLYRLMRSNTDNEYAENIFTTMFDFYGLPNDFPGYQENVSKSDKYECVQGLEEAFLKDISNEIENKEFIPYIQLHEFEALVFCGIDYLIEMEWCGNKGRNYLQNTLKDVGNPELINNCPDTAPSKRIEHAIELDKKQKYNKPYVGKYVTKQVGIVYLREQCKHFNEWIEKLTKHVDN